MTPYKRTGLQRLVCREECGGTVYATLAQVREGLPCCRCGAGFIPENVQLAYEVLSEEAFAGHPWQVEFNRQCGSVLHGQSSHVRRGRNVRRVEEVASERVAAAMAQDAKARKVSGLRQFSAAGDAIPF